MILGFLELLCLFYMVILQHVFRFENVMIGDTSWEIASQESCEFGGILLRKRAAHTYLCFHAEW